MKRIVTAILAALLCLSVAAHGAQNSNSPAASGAGAAKKRGPVFRATKEQIKEAQGVLKQRGLYAGEPTGKLDDTTRAALKKYQEAEGIRVTGTLNRLTLEKMGIQLTEKQKATEQQTTG